MVGALARYAIATVWPHPGTAFPWSTMVINISGCLLIGIFMVLIADVWPGQKLLRPFLGTGVLGGYTTFSTYIVDAQHLLEQNAAGIALLYLAATMIGALAAVFAGTALTRAAIAYTRQLKESRA
jgi:CrcB protein